MAQVTLPGPSTFTAAVRRLLGSVCVLLLSLLAAKPLGHMASGRPSHLAPLLLRIGITLLAQCASQTNWRSGFCYTLLSQCAKSHVAHCPCPIEPANRFFAALKPILKTAGHIEQREILISRIECRLM
jgi:hypothetical protein